MSRNYLIKSICSPLGNALWMAFFELLYFYIMEKEKKEFYVQPKIADKIVELNQEHALPVNIIVGECVNHLISITFEYDLIDYHIVKWLVNRGTQFYTQLPAEEIQKDYD